MEISVIIPVYNKAEYIITCLESLLEQDFDSFEVVCVNDGSTDASGALCDKMAAEHSSIRVIHTENGGVTAARRKGVEQALGRYIMFVDADDGLLPGALKTIHRAIEDSGADEVIAPFRTIQGHSSPIVYEGFTPIEPLVKAIITSKNRFPVLWSILFRRELLDDVLDIPRDIVEGEDKLMQVKVLMRQPHVFFIKEYVYHYNLGLPNSRQHTLERERLYDELLQETLAPRWSEFHAAFVLHQLKEYERFILQGHDEVRRQYYLNAVSTLPSGIPFYDRLVFRLPPRMARPLIRLYRKLIDLKQKGL